MTVLAYSPVKPSVQLFGAYEGIASASAINQTVNLTFTPNQGTLFVVPYESESISQLQLEVGLTPSSYIPNYGGEGTSASRAAESLTVPAANMPWPTPNVIGPELDSLGTVSVNAASGTVVASQPMVLNATSVYKVDVTITNYVSGSARLEFKSGVTTNYLSASETFYLLPGANGNVLFRTLGTTDLDVSISVREIDPLSVSIQMEGKITYADENLSRQQRINSWELNASNQIIHFLTTLSTNTGLIEFLQKENGTSTSVFTPGTTYASGVLVPFNIASRHGSTFINGATDGTARTEIVTPTALPDLSSSDLQLGYDYMGTIARFRVWDEDIADTGIEKATSYQPLIKSVGTIIRTPVATGAELVAYSGFDFNGTVYLKQPYNSDLAFGNGDFSLMWWSREDTIMQNRNLFGIYNPVTNSKVLSVYFIVNGYINLYINNSIGASSAIPVVVSSNVWNLLTITRKNGVISMYRDGILVHSTPNTTTIQTSETDEFRIGGITGLGPNNSNFALLRISATAPTPEQIQKIYNDEKHLFKENAKCTLYGSSDAVTALAYDDSTNLLHVGTSAGRSIFSGLERIDNTTTPITTAISAVNGMIAEQ